MKILITGFDPFGGDTLNPAFEAVRLLPGTISGATIVIQEVPTVFAKSAEVVREAILKHNPNVVLCVGQAGGRAAITVEKVAINLAEARIPDNEKNQPMDQKLVEMGDNAYFSTLPVKAIVANIREHGIPAHISYTAGTFVCNDIMYRLLHMLATEFTAIRGGFIHVPFDTAQVTERPVDTPSMPVTCIAKALEHAVEAIVAHTEDIHAVGGETH